MPDSTPDSRDDLVRLVAEQRARLGLSYERLALAGKANGDPDLNVRWLHRLENGEIRRCPDKNRLAVLARILRLPPKTVRDAAAAQYVDIDGDAVWNEQHTARVWIEGYSQLPPEEQAKVRRYLDGDSK